MQALILLSVVFAGHQLTGNTNNATGNNGSGFCQMLQLSARVPLADMTPGFAV